jgi:hypothetical protein
MPIESFSVAVPAGAIMSAFRFILPPRVHFGSPVQRSKDQNICYWHIPISLQRCLKIGPGELPHCHVYLDRLDGDRITEKIKLHWGDAWFGVTGESATLTTQVLLVPICWRSNADNNRIAYIADGRFISDREKAYPLQPDRKKHRFRLRIKSGKKSNISLHVYQVRVPDVTDNGHFTVEIEYEGEGSQ